MRSHGFLKETLLKITLVPDNSYSVCTILPILEVYLIRSDAYWIKEWFVCLTKTSFIASTPTLVKIWRNCLSWCLSEGGADFVQIISRYTPPAEVVLKCTCKLLISNPKLRATPGLRLLLYWYFATPVIWNDFHEKLQEKCIPRVMLSYINIFSGSLVDESVKAEYGWFFAKLEV